MMYCKMTNFKLYKYLIVFLFIPVFVFPQNKSHTKKHENAKEQVQHIVVSELNGAQELCRRIGESHAIPKINYEPVAPPKFWKSGLLTELGFSQISLTNWAAGGSGSIALNTYINGHVNYEKGAMYWENRAQLAYGFVQSFEDGYRKSDDKLILDSKFGYKAFDKFYFSAILNFKSQFTPGFEYPASGTKKVSQFLNPASLSFGLGLDYKPGKGKVFSINFSPITTTWVIVTDSTLRVKYGNKIDEPIRFELGAQLKFNVEKEIFNNLKIVSALTLFSDYLKKPQNVQIYWDFQALYQINKFLKTSLRTNLIYDDNVMIANKEGHEAARIQFKEVFSLNFSYTFGAFKKQ
ncbi:MAG: DUF3078 domain-containing protein [Bacteroidales bacterium]